MDILGKVFEDYFSEFQADMISICLEYVFDRVNKIYIYCSYEEGLISNDFFIISMVKLWRDINLMMH